MNPQFLLVLSPFLALLYVLFALIQALRSKRQGIFAALLAFAAAALSLAAYVLMAATPALRAQLEGTMLLNAIIVFAASLLILLVERRRKDRDPSRSYGMIGIGLSILLALGTYVTPLLANAVPSTNLISTTAANNRTDNTFQTISALTPGAVVQPDGPAATEAAPDGSADLAAVLSAQTGLSPDDLNAQLAAGSSIAQLVETHGGDLQAVTAAVKSALDALVASGGRGAQLLTRLGTDTTTVAGQIVQGQLPAQAQDRVIAMLTAPDGAQLVSSRSLNVDTSATPGSGSFPAPNNDTNNPPGSGNQPENGTPPPNLDNSGAPQFPSTATPEPASSLPPPTSTSQRPTRIAFPSVTLPPTLEATAQSTEAIVSASACTLVTNYNLNLRDKPTKDGSIVLLSIPMGTSVSADARTGDGWYHVSYDTHDGWVSGEYASASADCAALPAQ